MSKRPSEDPPGGRPPGDDRLADLGRKSAAERFEELDEREPERPPKPPQRARPSSVYSWVVGVVFLIVAALVALNTIPDEGEGLRGPGVGTRLPVFAAPSATGPDCAKGCDANLKQRPGQDSGNSTPACEVKAPPAVSVCADRGRRPVVLTLTTKGCGPQLRRVQAVMGSFPQVSFLGIVSGRPQHEVARLVRDDGLAFPVAIDPDGGLFNLYRVGVCPSTIFTGSDGKVRKTVIGEMKEPRLREEVARLR